MILKTSVIVTVYNLERYVAEAINSILNQTVVPDEIIVVDDGSTDGSVAEIKKFQKHVTLVALGQNQGVLPAFLAGIKASTGDILFFLDGDDVWYPTKVEKSLSVFRNFPNVMMVTHLHEWIDGNGNKTGTIDETHLNLQKVVSLAQNDIIVLDELLKKSILSYKGVWLGSAFSVRRGDVDWEAYEDWNKTIPGIELSHQDQPLAAYMIYSNQGKKIFFINEPLFQYRVFPNNSSGASTNIKAALKTIKRSIATVSRTYAVTQMMPDRDEERERQKNRLLELEFLESIYNKQTIKALKLYKKLFNDFWDRPTRIKETKRLIIATLFGPQKFLEMKTKIKFH